MKGLNSLLACQVGVVGKINYNAISFYVCIILWLFSNHDYHVCSYVQGMVIILKLLL